MTRKKGGSSTDERLRPTSGPRMSGVVPDEIKVLLCNRFERLGLRRFALVQRKGCGCVLLHRHSQELPTDRTAQDLAHK